MYRVIRVVAFRGGIKCHLYGANTGQSPNSVPMLGQRRIRLSSIEPAMGCDAGPTLNRYLVGRPTLCVRGTSYRRLHELIRDGGGRMVEGIGLEGPLKIYSLVVSKNYILDI